MLLNIWIFLIRHCNLTLYIKHVMWSCNHYILCWSKTFVYTFCAIKALRRFNVHFFFVRGVCVHILCLLSHSMIQNADYLILTKILILKGNGEQVRHRPVMTQTWLIQTIRVRYHSMHYHSIAIILIGFNLWNTKIMIIISMVIKQMTIV